MKFFKKKGWKSAGGWNAEFCEKVCDSGPINRAPFLLFTGLAHAPTLFWPRSLNSRGSQDLVPNSCHSLKVRKFYRSWKKWVTTNNLSIPRFSAWWAPPQRWYSAPWGRHTAPPKVVQESLPCPWWGPNLLWSLSSLWSWLVSLPFMASLLQFLLLVSWTPLQNTHSSSEYWFLNLSHFESNMEIFRQNPQCVPNESPIHP